MGKSIIRLSLLALLLCAIAGGLFLAQNGQQDRLAPREGPAGLGVGLEINEADGPQTGSAEAPEADATTPPPDVSAPTPLERAFDNQISLIEGVSEMALSGTWNYDGKAKNLALWDNVCELGNERVSALIARSDDWVALTERLERFCQGFSSTSQEIDDFLEVEIVDRAAGVNERAALEDSLETLGADGATRLAVSELSHALDTLNYARVLEVVWFLGIYRFEGQSEQFVLYQRPPSVETNLAVASAILCGERGGCEHDHPITLSLCLQFRDLPCTRPPTDLYDAINQILTGHEIETYNSMTSGLTRLLNEYRRLPTPRVGSDLGSRK